MIPSDSRDVFLEASVPRTFLVSEFPYRVRRLEEERRKVESSMAPQICERLRRTIAAQVVPTYTQIIRMCTDTRFPALSSCGAPGGVDSSAKLSRQVADESVSILVVMVGS